MTRGSHLPSASGMPSQLQLLVIDVTAQEQGRLGEHTPLTDHVCFLGPHYFHSSTQVKLKQDVSASEVFFPINGITSH